MNKDFLIWMLKGAAMGAADGIPGVSGGTIALIVGIYERFIKALASFRPSLFRYVVAKDFKGLWQAIDGTFLLALGIGIIVSLFTVLNLMHWLLTNAAPVVWAFFFGVILVSLWQLSIGRTWRKGDILLTILGAGISITFALAIRLGLGLGVEIGPLTLVLGGMLAITAMLLPGISGSFMLVLLGLYSPVVAAVHDREFSVILWVALGCFIGILSFSRLLQWLLTNWHDRVFSFMLGFIAGALVKVWPWQDENAGLWFTPGDYTLVMESSNMWVLALAASIAGGAVVYLLYKHTDN